METIKIPASVAQVLNIKGETKNDSDEDYAINDIKNSVMPQLKKLGIKVIKNEGYDEDRMATSLVLKKEGKTTIVLEISLDGDADLYKFTKGKVKGKRLGGTGSTVLTEIKKELKDAIVASVSNINITQIISKAIIESALPQYKKGNRVIVNFNTAKDPEYYVGTVSGVRKGLVYVVFDDGDKGSYKPTRSKTGLVGITESKRGRKSEIPLNQIDKWLSVDIGKASPKRKSSTNTVQKKSAKKFKADKKKLFHKYDLEKESNHPDGMKAPTNAQIAYAAARFWKIVDNNDSNKTEKLMNTRTEKTSNPQKLNAWHWFLSQENYHKCARIAKDRLERLGYVTYY